MVSRIIVHATAALWKFPNSLLYSVLFLLPKHRLVLINKLCGQVYKVRFRKKYCRRVCKVLSGQELSSLFAAFRTEKYQVLFKVQYIQALRLSEALSFRIDKISFEKGTAEILDCKKDCWVEIILHPKVVSLLRQWARDNKDMVWGHDGCLFFGKKTCRLSVAMARKRFYEARKRANLPDWCSSYALRHTRLNQLYDRTKDLRLVADFGRHSPETCLRYYMHADKEKLKRAVCTLSVSQLAK